MSDILVFEQPINERIRTFLRLEGLIRQFEFHHRHGSTWDNPIAINAILDLLSYTTRSDIKLEVLKELERQHARLERLAQRPNVDHGQLSSLLGDQSDMIRKLHGISGQIGHETQSVELLHAIRQKSSVPGIICDFDLPVLHFWLSRPESARREHLEKWFQPFELLQRAIAMILDVLRHSVEPSEEMAQTGFFQQAMDTNQAVQLLRISVGRDLHCYPEISAGKHRFSVRFLQNPNPAIRGEQTQKDIPFKLGICVI